VAKKDKILLYYYLREEDLTRRGNSPQGNDADGAEDTEIIMMDLK
jgi:hypothetical protein